MCPIVMVYSALYSVFSEENNLFFLKCRTKSKCQQQQNLFLVFGFGFWFQFIQQIVEHKLRNILEKDWQ